jgi:oligoendopeptidase F
VIVGLTVLLGALAILAPVEGQFSAIPSELTESYRFDLQRHFYPDEVEFSADLAGLSEQIARLEQHKGRVTADGHTLYEVLVRFEQVYPLWQKLWVYANLRYATNAEDMRLMHEIQEASGDLSSRLQFIWNEIERIDDETRELLLNEEPRLRDLEYAIWDIRRYRPHRLSLEQEELLARLDPLLLPWFEEMYQKIVDHTDFDSVQVATGERLDVRLDYGRLIRDEDRGTRRRTFLDYFGSYGQHRDLFAYVLLRELKTYNSLARLREFADHPEERFFDLHLEPAHVRNVYEQIEARSALVEAYEDLRIARIAHLSDLDTVFAWDMSIVPEDFARPRYDIVEATRVIKDALAFLGEDYQAKLASLLDPANGRIDIVSGPKRVPGAFSTGYYGHPHLFFSQKYEGYITDLSTLVHESGHAVHYQMVYEAGGRPLYARGPTYVTEAVAILNELLLKDHLWVTCEDRDLDTRIFFLEKLVGETMSLFWIAETAVLESALYDSLEADVLRDASDLDSLSLSVSRRFSSFTDRHPDQYRRLWSMVEHFYEQPMYNVNYVFASVLALRFYQQLKDDPGFVESYLALLRHPFDRPAPDMLVDVVGADLRDPALLEGAFSLMEARLSELQALCREAGVELE